MVDELEFVWDQIKNNSVSSSGSSPGRGVPAYTTQPRQFQRPLSGNDGPMRVLSPMSQDDEAERRSGYQESYHEDEEDENEYNEGSEKKDSKSTSKWRHSVEHAFAKMTAEIAALREQIATGREWQGKKRKSFKSWFAWAIWLIVRHALVDGLILAVVLLWLRRKKDRRIEDLVREAFKIGREYARKILPAR